MKKIKLPIIPFVIFIIAISCDPPKDSYYPNNADIVTIYPTILNYKDTFSLGDTIKFYFEVPDSISFNGKRTKLDINGSDYCSFNQTVSIIDTSHPIQVIRVFDSICEQLASIGKIDENSEQLYLGNSNGKFKSYYYILPKKQGVFLLNENNYGWMSSNNTSLRSNIHFDFGNVNRHFEYIIDNVIPSERNNFIQYFSNKGHNMPADAYAFYVK